MAKLFTREQIRAWLRENNLKDGASIENAFVTEIKDVLQEALEEEMNGELGYSKYDWKNKTGDNSRNGHSKKSVRSRFGKLDLAVPRDVEGCFEPVIVKKHERTVNAGLKFPVFADLIFPK
jgi:transposase-like protein